MTLSVDFSAFPFIEAERRRELCLEGHRWFDLRRTTRPAMERIGYENQVARLEKDDPRYVLQIPKRELSVNPGIGSNPR
ncbi:RagB/SusD family nutrient uptake outer membrane protein [Odoribacter splanchnicus]|uniref:RagB/SusD family nutrient uptake outer membrane protein n=1 Tax=Odoribacter splanchnicus TaxID=28118 RepID=UPI001E5E24FF|nr:RagB/SusD family nutrient uptake outer membrane protein [Odoribacter splanchnicus]